MNDEAPAAQNGNDSEPAPASHISQPTDTLTPQPATAEQLANVEEKMSSFEKATLRWAKIAVLMSGLAAIFVCAQWYEMHNGARDTRDLAAQAKRQADKIKDMSDAADKIRQAAQNMVTEEQRIADGARDSLSASNRQSKASLDATIEASHSDQRAWVVPSAFKLSEEPPLNKDVTVTISIVNTGKSPALENTNQSVLLFWNTEPPQINFAAPSNPSSKTIVAPNIAGDSFTTDPIKLTTAEQMDAYTKKINKIYVEAKIGYRDVFAKPHWTRICAYHVSGDSLDTFHFCQNGNEVDQQGNKAN